MVGPPFLNLLTTDTFTIVDAVKTAEAAESFASQSKTFRTAEEGPSGYSVNMARESGKRSRGVVIVI